MSKTGKPRAMGKPRRRAYTTGMTELADTFDGAFTKAVDLGNKLADRDKDADLWDIADGLLAGALQYWLYSRQPCGDPRCNDCMPIRTDRKSVVLGKSVDFGGR